MPANRTVVVGTVRDPIDEPVPQGRVYIASGPEPVPDIAALTNVEGQFALTLPSCGQL